MTASMDLNEKVALWRAAFEEVRREIVPDEMRTILAQMNEVEGVAQLASYMQLANQVMASDRTAAEVASRLIIGVRPLDLNG